MLGKYLKGKLFKAGCKRLAEELTTNADYYADVAKFNFGNSVKSKQGKKINFNTLPSEVVEELELIREDHFCELDNDSLFRKLGLEKTDSNQFSPLEAKYTFHYIKMYGDIYDAGKIVSKNTLIKPLSKAQKKAYLEMF